MFRSSLTTLMFAALVTAACGSGVREHWLYPAPHLVEGEGAVFIAHESHRVLEIDGEETAIRCWGEAQGPRPYAQEGSPCRLHIRPGEHTVTFSPAANSRDRVRVNFTARPGASYGLDWSTCRGSLGQTHQATCRVDVIELEGPPPTA